jgi:hypothetical protein
MRARAVFASAALAMAVATSSVSAQANERDDQATLRLNVSGTIASRCMISFADTRIVLNLGAAVGQVRLPFDVDCNDRMSVQLRSRLGALQHERSASIIPSVGFGSEQPYRLSLALGSGEGSRSYESRDIFAAPAVYETAAIPGVTTGQLSVAWERSQPLLGGRYYDIIEIRVSAAGETDERG